MKDPLETMALVVDTNRYCTIQWGVFEALVGWDSWVLLSGLMICPA